MSQRLPVQFAMHVEAADLAFSGNQEVIAGGGRPSVHDSYDNKGASIRLRLGGLVVIRRDDE